MFEEWKQRRELQRKIKLTGTRRRALSHQALLGLGDLAAASKVQREYNSLKQELELFESRMLLRKARRLAIELPKNHRWWSNDNEDGSMPPESVTTWLSEEGRIGVAKLIKEEKKKNIEWWVKTLTPLFGVLISLLSLLIALISVSKK